MPIFTVSPAANMKPKARKAINALEPYLRPNHIVESPKLKKAHFRRNNNITQQQTLNLRRQITNDEGRSRSNMEKSDKISIRRDSMDDHNSLSRDHDPLSNTLNEYTMDATVGDIKDALELSNSQVLS